MWRRCARAPRRRTRCRRWRARCRAAKLLSRLLNERFERDEITYVDLSRDHPAVQVLNHLRRPLEILHRRHRLVGGVNRGARIAQHHVDALLCEPKGVRPTLATAAPVTRATLPAKLWRSGAMSQTYLCVEA